MFSIRWKIEINLPLFKEYLVYLLILLLYYIKIINFKLNLNLITLKTFKTSIETCIMIIFITNMT